MEKAKYISPEDVFSAFNDIPLDPKIDSEGEGTKLLRYIAESRHLEVIDVSRKKLISELSKNVSSAGLSVMLRVLKLRVLRRLAQNCDWGEKKQPSIKATIAKKIYDTMEEITPKKFLKQCNPRLLRKILRDLEVDIPSSKKDYVDTIIKTATAMGLENCFSSFPPRKLKEFIKACGLKVDSDTNMDVLLDCLIEQESKIAPFKLVGDESPSKEKPPIDKNISVVDLLAHYYREDLVVYLKENQLISGGSKKELVERIRRFLDGKIPEESKERIKKKEEKEKESESDSSTPSSTKSSPKKRTSRRPSSSDNDRKPKRKKEESEGKRRSESKKSSSDDESEHKKKEKD